MIARSRKSGSCAGPIAPGLRCAALLFSPPTPSICCVTPTSRAGSLACGRLGLRPLLSVCEIAVRWKAVPRSPVRRSLYPAISPLNSGTYAQRSDAVRWLPILPRSPVRGTCLQLQSYRQLVIHPWPAISLGPRLQISEAPRQCSSPHRTRRQGRRRTHGFRLRTGRRIPRSPTHLR